MEASIDYMVLRPRPRPSRGYELSLDSSFAKVGRNGDKVLYVREENEQFDVLFFSYYYYYYFIS